MTTLDPRGALLIARLILARMRENNIKADAIGGLTMGADPIVSAVAVVSGLEGAPLPAFIVRKETKGHGTQRYKRSEAAGYQVVAAFCVVDREEGGTELVTRKYPLYSLFTAKDLL
jgi:orotate phosphoribosyltransferase